MAGTLHTVSRQLSSERGPPREGGREAVTCCDTPLAPRNVIHPLGYMVLRPGSFCVLTSAVPGLKHLKLIKILFISILIPTRQKTGNMYFRASADAELDLG